MQIVYLPSFPENPTNPARCHLPTGRIEINLSRWQFLTPEEKEFILFHEIGHFKKQTFSEEQADAFALKQLAFKKPYSLKNFVKSVSTVSKSDDRQRAAEKAALQLAAADGSQKAQELLKNRRYANATGEIIIKREVKMINWIIAIVTVGGIGWLFYYLLKNFNK